MAVDPNISLSVAPPPSPNGQFDNASKVMGIIGQMNQNKLFQQQFMANSMMGQIFASSPDPETAIARIMQSPAAPWASTAIAGYRQAALASQQLANEQQTGAEDGMKTVLGGIGTAINDPSQLLPAIQARLKLLSPANRARVEPMVMDFANAVTDGLPQGSDPETKANAMKLLNHRIVGSLIGSGIATADNMRGMTGTLAPQYQPVGPGGAMTPVGSEVAPMPSASPQGNALGASPTGPQAPGGGIPNAPTGPSIEQQKYAEGSGKAGADMSEDMASNARVLPQNLKRLDMMNEALTQFQTGGGADFRSSMAKMLQALKNIGVPGIDDKTIDEVGNSNLGAAQLFNKEVKPLVISELKSAAQGTGRVMRSEVDAFLSMMDNTTDPRALMKMLNQARFSLQVGYDQSQKFTTFKQLMAKNDPSVKGLDLTDFPAWYNMNFRQSALPGQNASGGMSLSPVPEDQAKGIPNSRPPLSSFFKPAGQ